MSAMSRSALTALPALVAISAAVLGAGLPLVSGCQACEGEPTVTFTAEASGTEVALHDAEQIGEGVVVAVGDGGVIVTRSPEGAWSIRPSGTTRELSAVASRAFGEQVFVTAVGQGGTIVFSNDGGMTWELVDSGVSADLRAVAGGTVVVAVGDGVIVRSPTSGHTWTVVEPPEAFGSLHAVAGIEPPAGPKFVAVGDGGAVFLSGDGTGWIRRDAGTTADLRAAGVYRGGGGLGLTPLFWVAGVDGTVRAMLDGSGERWETVELGLDGDVVDVTPESDWLLAADGSLHDLSGTLGPSDPWFPPQEQVGQRRLLGIGGSLDEAWLVGEAGMIVRARLMTPYCPTRY